MVNLAKELVPQIEAHEGAICGEIDHVNKLTRSLFQPNDMILCRTSAPLVGLCMKLIENGISAVVKGKDIAQGLLNLIENANTDNIDNLLKYLNNEKQKMIAVIKSERKCSDSDAMESARYRNLDDRCKCIENICLYHLKDTKQLKMYVSVLFTDERIKML